MSAALDQFRAAYSSAFHDYATGAGERNLERAYELGRTAVTERLSMLDVAAIHHELLARALDAAGSSAERARVAKAATEFVIESLSTFEMAQRGFREAQDTARLEQQHAAQLRGLAQASLEINASSRLQDIPRLVTGHAREIVGARRAVVCLAPGADWRRAVELAAPSDGGRNLLVRHERPALYALVCDTNRPLRMTREELELNPAWSAEEPPVPAASWLAAPLIDRAGRNAGLIHLSGKLEGEFSENDQAMLVQLAQMAAVAIENTRLYEQEHEIAETLQRSLLPPHLPEIPDMSVAARFRPAGDGTEIGGDFYDIFETGRGTWGIAIGDVCGKGAAAASVTALARYTLRATALHERRPAQLLTLLNEALMRHAPEQRFCTVAYATVDPRRRTLEIATGGHPLPLLVRDGQVEQLGSYGTVLGVIDQPKLTEREIELSAGDTLVFYTDGVTDAHAPERQLAACELAAALSEFRDLSPSEVAARVEELALRGSADPPRDDIAILVLSLEAGGSSRHLQSRDTEEVSLELAFTPEAAGEARSALAPLAERLGETLHATVKLLVTELVTNSVKYARGNGEPLRLRVALTPQRVRVEALDGGPGFEPPPPSEDVLARPSGWGLHLVDKLSDRWGVESADGTSVWFEIDRSA